MQATLQALAKDLALKGYVQSTQKLYYQAAEDLMKHFGRAALELTREDLRDYVEQLREKQPKSRFRQSLCALLFLYQKSLGHPELVSFIALPKRYSALPVVLSVKEVDQLIKAIRDERFQALAMVMYGAGLRVAEARSLEIRDIDGERGVIHVRHGKGNIAREAKLSPALYEWLRSYWSRCQPAPPYLFSQRHRAVLPRSNTINNCLKQAAKDAFIKKPVTAHVLRHSFATHLLEAGVDGFTVSAMLGHKTLKSTTRYARVTRKVIRQTPGPLDLLAPPKRSVL